MSNLPHGPDDAPDAPRLPPARPGTGATADSVPGTDPADAADPADVDGATDGAAHAGRWTCPFCPLLCDDLRALPPDGGGDGAPLGWQLTGGECPRAQAALDALPPSAGPAAASGRCWLGDRLVPLPRALDAAAALLRAARAPLFGGLGTDVAGARALYALACHTGAICDAAQGLALMSALRALQDRGGYTTTLAELRSRADLVLCLGGLPDAAAPRIFERPQGQPPHQVVQLAGDASPGHPAECVAAGTDLLATLAELTARVMGRLPPVGEGGALDQLARRLHAARYAVVIGEPGRWGAHAGLVVETCNRLVTALNQRSRAAALWLGGGDGAATVNQVLAWLSGLPLRSRAGGRGIEHEPVAWDARRLLADGAVDALLWIDAFGRLGPPPLTPTVSGLPLVVLAAPGAGRLAHAGPVVHIEVSTPGIGSAGHLVRSDGTVLLPLMAARPDGLPTVAQVLAQLAQRLAPGVPGATPPAPGAQEVAHG